MIEDKIWTWRSTFASSS